MNRRIDKKKYKRALANQLNSRSKQATYKKIQIAQHTSGIAINQSVKRLMQIFIDNERTIKSIKEVSKTEKRY